MSERVKYTVMCYTGFGYMSPAMFDNYLTALGKFGIFAMQITNTGHCVDFAPAADRSDAKLCRHQSPAATMSVKITIAMSVGGGPPRFSSLAGAGHDFMVTYNG